MNFECLTKENCDYIFHDCNPDNECYPPGNDCEPYEGGPDDCAP